MRHKAVKEFSASISASSSGPLMKNKTIKTVKQDAVSHTSNNRIKLLPVAIATVVASMSAPAWSLSFQPTDEVSIDWDTSLNYTAAWRMSDANDDLLANVAGDDGNRNFDKGSMINNRISVLSEVDIRYQNLGAFVRGSAFYDGAYFGKNDNDSPLTSNNSSVAYNEFTKETQDAHGRKARLLDAFVYGNFELGERNLNLRVGRQVVNWGEGLFISGGINNGLNPADATKSNVAGVEVKDILLPTGQVFAQLDLTDNFNVAAFYQWEWQKTEINAVGSYFSISDILDEGGENLIPPEQAALIEAGLRQNIIFNPQVPLPAIVKNAVSTTPFDNHVGIRRGKDVEADDHGQWGVAFNYFAENLGNGTELGLYYINYHEKNPVQIVTSGLYQPYSAASIAANPLLQGANAAVPGLINNSAQIPNVAALTNYHIEYMENTKLIGASFGTLIGDTNVGGEISYRKGTPVRLATGLARKNTIQAQLSMIHSFGVTRLADDFLFAGEIGYNRVQGVKEDDLAIDAFTGERTKKYGSGIAARFTLKYNNVLPATNLEIPISFRHNIDGHSAAGTFTRTANNTDRMSIGANVFYQDQWEAGLSYNAFFGSAKDNAVTDRDYVALNVKYLF
ncbi:DUF1302 domain-containing protein [Endozoicomonas arenosclerae]|uniref:DUF1302 domain-containing protein n=1 Tax=Endozoicomonas arenosclerae TaxID=1633495 RepID=UPI000783F2B2|nr:DUF1302 domain-containing protein [Endozoicomonas arenosclerae]